MIHDTKQYGVGNGSGFNFVGENVPAFVHTKVSDMCIVLKIFLNDRWIVEFEELIERHCCHAPVEAMKVKLSQIMMYIAFVGSNELTK